MKTKIALCLLLLATGVATAGTQIGFAESTGTGKEPTEAEALMKSKVTLVQAAQLAETKAGGKAASVDFISQEGTSAPFYEVEIVTADGSREDFAIDASTGEVMKLANRRGD